MGSPVDGILLIAGVLLCLMGFVAVRAGTYLIGCVMGLAFGFAFGVILAEVLQLGGESDALILLATSALGIFTGFFLVKTVTWLVFGLAGFLFGAFLGRVLFDLTAGLSGLPGERGAILYITLLAAGLLGAFLGVALKRYLLIVITSFIGAQFIIAAVRFGSPAQEIWFLGIFALSVAVQAVLTGGQRKRLRD